MLDAETVARSTLVIPPVPADQRGLAVAAWSEPMVIDTYLPGPPSRFPSFLDERVYQGSSGRIYPLPHHEHISADKRPHRWQALHLENTWIRLVLLPELGGRIHVGYDKVADYDFFYRNNVIKPALVGLAGPWISGGVEFNWPQHHRPGTFLPTDWEIEHEADGSVTIWCSDHDPMTRMKGMHGIRLRPDSTVVEARVRLHNRTDLPQTFLWWANVAAAVNDDYQSFFPPDVRQVADHAKRAVTSFPRAGTYYGVDYPSRVGPDTRDADRLDWYRNIPVPTSYMVTSTRHAFFGGYDHGRRAGFVHWADPGISPGKKQWTWGNAAFGHAWNANLTDDDGPYVELMAGVFTDNQPDFAFIAPGETKSFSQFWYPIREIGPAHHATLDVAVRLDVLQRDAGASVLRVGIAATRVIADAVIEVLGADGSVVAQWVRTLRPDSAEILEHPADPGAEGTDGAGLSLRITSAGTELLRWNPGEDAAPEPLRPAVEPPAPSVIGSTEELVLTGGHLEQYRHATRRPQPYWLEALRRDPDDIRANIALGARCDADGLPDQAAAHFRRAVERLTALAPTPRTGEAHYRWGRSLAERGRDAEAVPLLARAAWDAAWCAPARWVSARIAARAGDPGAAESHARAVLDRDPHHLGAGCLLAIVLRATDRADEAAVVLRAQLAADPLHQWSRDLAGLTLTDDAPTLLDVALDHAECGATQDALRVLDLAADAAGRTALGQVQVGPLVHYHRAMVLQRSDCEAAAGARAAARATDATDTLASRPQDVLALLAALEFGPDPRAQLLLGNWFYDRGRHLDAIAAWTEAADGAAGDPDLAVIAHRNLGLAAVNVLHDTDEAARHYTAARLLAPDDARLLSEQDQLLARRGAGAAERFSRLVARPGLVAERDDLTVTAARLLCELDRPDEAVELLQERRFQPWEGGEGQVLAAWERAQIGVARRAMADGDRSVAVAAMEQAVKTPDSLGEARHPLANAAELHWWWGRALDSAGDHAAAAVLWERAAQFSGDFTDMSTSRHSVQTVHSVLALRALGRPTEAAELLGDLSAYIDELAATPAEIDYFATSLPSMLLFHTDPQASRDTEIAALRAAVADIVDPVAAPDMPSAHRIGITAPPARPDAMVASGDHRDQRNTP